MTERTIEVHRFFLARFFAIFFLIFSMGLPICAQEAAEKADADLLFQSMNQERFSRGLEPLHNNAALARAARLHAQRMAAANKVSHQLPGEPKLMARIQQQHLVATAASENVGEAPSAMQVHGSWMISPAPSANILDTHMNAVGFGVVKHGGELFVTEDFARTVEVVTRQQQEQQVGHALSIQHLSIQEDSSLARAYCGKTPPRSSPLPKLVMDFITTDLSRLPKQVKERLLIENAHVAAVGACAPQVGNVSKPFRIIVLLY